MLKYRNKSVRINFYTDIVTFLRTHLWIISYREHRFSYLFIFLKILSKIFTEKQIFKNTFT